MSRLFRRIPPRIPHVEPGFTEPGYVAEYSKENSKHAAGDIQPLCDFVASRLSRNGRAEILEIGAGPGWVAIAIAQAHLGVRVTGIDISQAFIDIANRNKLEAGVQDRVNFTYGEADTMANVQDNAFDFVVSHQSLHYWNSPARVFDQIARVLKPDGAFFISDDRRDLNWLGRLQVLLGVLVLSRRIGQSWQESLRGCYSADEVRQMLQDSALRDRWEMSLYPRLMTVHSPMA